MPKITIKKIGDRQIEIADPDAGARYVLTGEAGEFHVEKVVIESPDPKPPDPKPAQKKSFIDSFFEGTEDEK